MSAQSSAAAGRIGFREFVALIAAMMACQAIAIDAMLPALPTIGRALGLLEPNHAQYIVFAYVAGLGCGQLVWGMFSDRYGRRRILLIGLALYTIAALLCSSTASFAALLGWRFAHGLAAATIAVARSAIRDQYSGARMARVLSLTFIVFLTVPVLAPSLGQLLLLVAPWRYLFVMIGSFSGLVWLWALLRLPETLHPEYRLALAPARVAHAFALVLGNRVALCYALAAACVFGSLLSYLGMVQQIFSDVLHRPQLMPAVFAICAAAMGVAAYLNSRWVERLGMRVISHAGLLLLTLVAALHALVVALGLAGLGSFIVLQSVTLACVGLTVANFGALALEPLGAVAGVAASLQGFIYMSGGALFAALIGGRFNNSMLPLALGASFCGLCGIACVLIAEHGRLFRSATAALACAAAPSTPASR